MESNSTKTKAEINKATFCKIAANYYDQQVAVFGTGHSSTYLVSWMLHRINHKYQDEYTNHSNWHLELTPLGAISNQDAAEVFKIYMPAKDSEGYSVEKQAKYGRQVCLDMIKNADYAFMRGSEWLRVIDFLRSRGYALPYGQWSVQELVEFGIFKIII